MDSSFDAEWKTTTKLEEVSFTTTFGIIKENNTNSNNQMSAKEFALVNAVLATVLVSCAVAETVITVGTGIYNDWPAISYAISQWINYNNVATDNLATVY